MPNQGTSLEIEQHESSGFFWVYRTVGWWPWLVVALGLLLLALVHATLIRGSIERDLQARARAVLDQQGADQVRADFVGRDGRLSGELPAEIDAQELADQVKSIDGARVVTADFGGGQVVDQATADRLEKAAVEAFGEGKVANELTVAPGLSGEGIEEFAALLKPMQQTVAAGGQATARLADGDLALSGSLPQNADTAPLLQSASGVADATGGTVRDNLTGATAESSAATGASEPSAATVEPGRGRHQRLHRRHGRRGVQPAIEQGPGGRGAFGVGLDGDRRRPHDLGRVRRKQPQGAQHLSRQPCPEPAGGVRRQLASSPAGVSSPCRYLGVTGACQ